MPISTEELEGGITRVILEGRLDIEGAAAVDMRMNVIAGTKKAVLVDLQKVSFLGSNIAIESEVVPVTMTVSLPSPSVSNWSTHRK